MLYKKRKSKSLKISEPVVVKNYSTKRQNYDFGTISSCGSAFTDSEVRYVQNLLHKSIQSFF